MTVKSERERGERQREGEGIVTLFPSPGSAPVGHKFSGVFGMGHLPFTFVPTVGHLLTLYFRTSASRNLPFIRKKRQIPGKY